MPYQTPPSDLVALGHSADTIEAAMATGSGDEDTLGTIARNIAHIRTMCAREDIIALGESLAGFLATADEGEAYLVAHT